MSTQTTENRMLWRDAPGYEEARLGAVWNARKPDRFPDVIVTVESDEDVVDAVNLARSRGMTVAIRGGGHSMCGSPVREGGMLIDLSQLRGITVDRDAGTATVQPGVSAREVADALGEHGLAFPVGHCGSVPVSGYLLAGGLGWNMGAWGPACFSMEALDVVTAAGELLSVDETRHPDLLWAARGAGPGFFGVATRFTVRAYPLPGAIRASTYVYPLAEVEEVSRWAAAIAPSLPPTVETLVMLGSAPPATESGPAGKVVGVTAVAFSDSEAEATDALAVFETCPSIRRALIRQVDQPSSFAALHDMNGARLPEAHRYVEDTIWSDDGLGELLPRVAEHIAVAPSTKSLVMAAVLPQGSGDTALPDAAFSMVGRTFLLGYAIWENGTDDERNERWHRTMMASVEPRSIGHYIAEADLGAGRRRSERSFAPANWGRLHALRRTYDPDNLFQTYLDAVAFADLVEAGGLLSVPFDDVYERDLAPWDVAAPQPGFVDLADAGRVQGKVLDVGCGTGELALCLAGLGHEVTGLDASATAIGRARAKAAERGSAVRFALGDACDLDALGETFDTVVDSGLFHVLSDHDRRRFIAGLHHVVRPDGRYHVLCFNEHATLPGPRRITQDELRAAFADGWRVESIVASCFDLVYGRQGAEAWLASFVRAT